MRQLLFRGNVIEDMGTEDQIALGGRVGREDRLCDCLGMRHGLLKLVEKIEVGFDGDRASERVGEGARHRSVARAGIDKDLPGRQSLYHLLQPSLGISFLIRMIEKDLKGFLVALSLRVEGPN